MRGQRPLAGRVAVALLAAMTLLACDDRDDPPPAEAEPMDEACDRIAHDLCDALAVCCAAEGQSSSDCLAAARARCAPFADDVRAGRARYDESAARACADEEKVVFGDCSLTVLSYTLASSGALLSCQRIFSAGQAAPGEPCGHDADCAPVPRPGTLAYCDSDDDRCAVIELLGEGAACTAEESEPLVEICGQDLFCREPGQTVGSCVAKTPTSGPCSGTVTAPCVSEAFCDAASGTCRPRRDGGEACASPSECRSLSCPGGVCDAATSFFDARVCGGDER